MHYNYFFIASLSLKLPKRPDIDCPGDTLSYNCSILSNSENSTLVWSLILPGFDNVYSIFGAESTVDEFHSSGPAITFRLTEYVDGEYIESILTFTVGRHFTVNRTSITCEIPDLATENVELMLYSAGKN